MYLCVTLPILPLKAYMRTRIPREDLLFPYYHRIRDDGLWNVWHSNPLKTPYIVACFSSESEALAHAKDLNALYRAESDASAPEEPRGPSLLQRMLGAAGQLLRLRS